MFEFLLLSRSNTRRNRLRPSPLAVEVLESRYCPSGTITLDALVMPGHEVRLSGQVTGEYAAGATVSFSGVVEGSVTADSSGNYTFITSTVTEGEVYAVGMHEGRAFTPADSEVIDVTAPALSLGVTGMTASTITLSGTLTDIDYAYQTIDITGAPISSVVTDSSGYFSFTLNRAELGMVSVSETDLWGQTSNQPAIDVANPPPFISEFTAEVTQAPGIWIFRGQVLGSDVDGLVISFAGMPSMVGQTTTVGADGWFTFTRTIASGEFGYATAQTVTTSGQTSNVASAYVNN